MDDGFDDVEPDFGVHGVEIGVVNKLLLIFGMSLGVIDAVNDFGEVLDYNKDEDKRGVKSEGGLERDEGKLKDKYGYS
jgi:hypothetical protein